MISTKGRYALRVMIDLAEHRNGSFIPLKDIAARQEISKKYLEIRHPLLSGLPCRSELYLHQREHLSDPSHVAGV